jgi:hypothetical protein
MASRKLTQAQIDGLAKGRATRAANLEKRKVEPTAAPAVVKPRKSLKQENQKLKDVIKVCEDAVKSLEEAKTTSPS